MSNPFTNWSAAQVAAHNARVQPANRIQAADHEPTPDGCEADLHAEIAQECRRRGWIALHGSMAHKTKRTLGETDFCCLLPGGIVLFAECKTKRGKLTPEQLAMSAWMANLGHKMHIVRSLSEFLSAAEQCLTGDSGNLL